MPPRPPGDVSHLAERLAQTRSLARRGRLVQAENELSRLVEESERLNAPTDLQATVRNQLAEVQWAQGNSVDVERTSVGTINMLRDALHEESRPGAERARSAVAMAHALIRLATLRKASGARTGAEVLVERAIGEVLRRAMVLWERNLPADETPASNLSRMAQILMREGMYSHAERVLRLELQERERTSQSARRISRARIHLGQCLMQMGRASEAESALRKALDERVRAADPPEAITKARCWYAMGLLAHHRSDEAESLLLEGLREVQKLGDNPSARAALRYSLARVHMDTGRREEAVALLRKGMDDLELASSDPSALNSRQARLLSMLQAPGGGERLLKLLAEAEAAGLNPGALEQLRRQLGREDPSSMDDGARTFQGMELGDLDQLLPDPDA